MKCEKCNHDTPISFDEWKLLTDVMFSFIRLSKEQKDMILLMVDGALYRAEKSEKFAEQFISSTMSNAEVKK